MEGQGQAVKRKHKQGKKIEQKRMEGKGEARYRERKRRNVMKKMVVNGRTGQGR